MPLYPAASQHASCQATAVACRCCPGGASRSTRAPRYPSDMSEGEWAVTEPTLPGPAWQQGRGGRPATHCRRDVVDALRYLVKEGIQWRAMPADFLSDTYRAGTSRHGAPVRTRHRIPSISCRLLHFGGRPGFLPRGNSGSSTFHCASVRSARPVAGTVGTRSPERWSSWSLTHLPQTSRHCQ